MLVSRTIASFTTSSNLPNILKELYDCVSLCDQNCLHGSLLTVSLLLKERKELLCSSEKSGVLCWLVEAHLKNSYIASRQVVSAYFFIWMFDYLYILCLCVLRG